MPAAPRTSVMAGTHTRHVRAGMLQRATTIYAREMDTGSSLRIAAPFFCPCRCYLPVISLLFCEAEQWWPLFSFVGWHYCGGITRAAAKLKKGNSFPFAILFKDYLFYICLHELVASQSIIKGKRTTKMRPEPGSAPTERLWYARLCMMQIRPFVSFLNFHSTDMRALMWESLVRWLADWLAGMTKLAEPLSSSLWSTHTRFLSLRSNH